MSDFTWTVPTDGSSPAAAWVGIKRAVQQWFSVGSGLPGNHVIWRGSNRALPDSMWIELHVEDIETLGRDVLQRALNVIAVPTITVTAIDTSADTLTAAAHGRLTGDGALRLSSTATRPAGMPDADLWAITVDDNTLRVAASFQLAMAGTWLDITGAGSGTITLAGTATTTRAGRELVQRVQGPRTATLVARCYTGIAPGADATTCMLTLDQALGSRYLDTVAPSLVAAGVGIGATTGPRLLGGTVNSSIWEPFAETRVALHFASDLASEATYIEIVNTSSTIS